LQNLNAKTILGLGAISTVSWRIWRFVAAVELLTSLVLYALAPTDGIRVWYPSSWAYVGEHGLVWVAAFVALLWTMRTMLSVRTDALTVSVGIAAEVIATVYVWFVIPASGEVSRAWYTGRFADYFITRIETWCVLAILATSLYLILYRRDRRIEKPTF
jgi:hypothetical protein